MPVNFFKMKKIALLFALLLSLAAAACPAGKTVPKRELAAIVSEFSACDGVEVVRLGRLGTAAVRGVVRAAASSDPETRPVLDLIRGIRRVAVMDYEDCAPQLRERIARRLDRALDGSELLMEARDGNESFRVFGLVDEETGVLRDFVLHAPADGALVYLTGTLSPDALVPFIE